MREKNISQTADWVSVSIFIKITNITLRKTAIEVVFSELSHLEQSNTYHPVVMVPTATTSMTTNDKLIIGIS